ncbi:restriction endonuclease [Serratia marcescens]|nr:restriction endonuclease [Serratia marcescens]
MSWPMVKLGDVCTINPRLPKNIDLEQEVTFLAMAAVSEKGEISSQETRILHETKKGFTYFERGDVLLAKITPCFENGKATLTNSLNTQIGFGSTEFHVLRAIPELILPEYIFYLIWNEKFRIAAVKEMTGSAGQKRVSADYLKEYQFYLPSIFEQEKIISALNKGYSIHRKRQQAIKLADDFLRATFLDMFGDPVENPKKLKKSPITELADIITGFAFKSNDYVGDSSESVRLCRGVNTLTGYLDWADTKFWPKNKLEKLDNYLIKAGDIILAMDRPWISNGLKVCIFPESQRETYLVQRVARLRPRSESYVNYIYSCIKSPAFEKHCCPTETTVPHISPVELKNFEVLIPPDELMDKFHSIASTINNSLNKMASGDISSDALLSKLSQQAFSGHLKR